MSFRILENEPMSKHTTFRTGGTVKTFYEIGSVEGLIEVLDICKKNEESPLIIGNGSNLLVSDNELDFPVIELGNGFASVKLIDDDTIEAEAGAKLSVIAKLALDNELAGFEFASGIPGSLGGAVFMNAGAYGGEMKDVVADVTVLKDGELQVIKGADMDFSYRHSKAMDDDMIVVSARIKLHKGNKDEILEIMNDLNGRRRDKQPLEYPSAGSTFKRPEGYFAGKLIQDAGLAGKQVGGAQVSSKHCGFVINYDNATSDDIYSLIKLVQKEVLEQFGVELETEVRLIGDFK